MTPQLDAVDTGRQLGADGVENVVTNAERICSYEQQRLELTNESTIVGLKMQFQLLADEERRIEDRLRAAPPPGDLRRLRQRAVYYWSLTLLLTLGGFAFTLLTFAPFRLGWKSWLYCAGIAVVTPFLVEKLLDGKKMEAVVKAVTAAAAVAALTSLMLLAIIRGNLLAQEIHQDAAPAVVLDDTNPQPAPQNTFYDSTLVLLRAALLLLAFTMEVGAGLALSEAWRMAPDSSEDWNQLRNKLIEVRQCKAETVRQAITLRNEPACFAARFWRDFYCSLLSNAVRSAMTKLLLGMVVLFTTANAHAAEHLNLAIAIDLTQSVSVSGLDGKNEFQKNIDGVTRILSQVSAGTHVTVFAITDHSFSHPYIILSGQVQDDPGYFGERLVAARNQLVQAWKQRGAHLDAYYPQTDIFGALFLASQIFASQPNTDRKILVIFSDMRQYGPEGDLESPQIVPPFSAKQCGSPPNLNNVQVFALGVDNAGKSTAYWQSLQRFWGEYFQHAGAALLGYSVLREVPPFAGLSGGMSTR